MKKLTYILLLLLCFSFIACNESNQDEKRKITDLLNREVEIKKEINRVVCIGAGSLRLYSYVGDMNKLCGVEDVDKDGTQIGNNLAIRPYKVVNKDILNKLPSCGVGGPQSQVAEAEKILMCKPDIIFSIILDVDAMNTLQEQTKIPVVCVSYGKTEAFDENVKKSLTLMGDILDRKERAKELTDYIDGIVLELNEKTKDVAAENKPSIYLACQSNYGIHGIESSSANYSIFNVSNIKNVLDINGYQGYQKNVDLEALLTMNPDKIIIDAGGLELLKSQYEDLEKASIFNAMKAFKTKEVYLQLPYNAYYTNLEIAYCNAYFDAYVAYQDIFDGFDYVLKAREIIKMFLGDRKSVV